MIMVCLIHGLFIWQNFESYEEKRFGLAQILPQECEAVRYSFPYTNSLFPGAVDAPYEWLLNSGNNSLFSFVENHVEPSKWIQ